MRTTFLRHIVFIFLLAGSASFAQDSVYMEDVADEYSVLEEYEEDSMAYIPSPDSMEIIPTPESFQNFDEDKWNKIIKDFDYSTVKKVEQKKQQMQPSTFPLFVVSLLKILFWIVVIGVPLFLIIFFARRYYSNPSNSKMKSLEIEVHDFIPENIAELNVEQMLYDAITAKKHKEAVRLHYLIILKELNDKKYILLKKNSISRDFLQQMSKRKEYFAFQKATLLFERVWYGDADMNDESFPLVENVFKDFIELIRVKK